MKRAWAVLSLVMHVALGLAPAQVTTLPPVRPQRVADTLGLTFDKLTRQTGLPYNYVHCLTRDAEGFLWFGTRGGLCRFDGRHYVTFNATTRPNALPADEIMALATQPGIGGAAGQTSGDVALWIGTMGGLARYDMATGRIRAVATPGLPQATLRGINRVLWQAPHFLWVNDDQRLVRYVVTPSGQLTQGREIRAVRGHRVNTFALLPDGAVWIGSYFPTAFRIPFGNDQPDARFTIPTTAKSHQPEIRSLYLDGQQTLWVGTYSDGLWRYNPRTNTLRRVMFFANGQESSFTDHDRIRSFAAGRSASGEELLYMATYGDGLLVYNPVREQFISYRADRQLSSGLSANNIRQMMADQGGNLWLATQEGVNVYRPGLAKVLFRELPVSAGQPLPFIDGVIEDRYRPGRLYLYGTEAGLRTYEPLRGALPVRPSAIANHTTLGAYQDRPDRIWVLSPDELGTVSLPDGAYASRFSVAQLGRSVQFMRHGIRPGPAGTFLLATTQGSVFFDPQQGNVVKHLHDPHQPAQHPFNEGMGRWSRQSGLWLCGENSPLLVYVPDPLRSARYESWPIRAGRQGVGYIENMVLDSLRQELRVYTSNGLFVFNIQQRAFRYVGVEQGLPEQSLHDALLLPNGAEWLLGTRSLRWQPRPSATPVLLNDKDGLRLNNSYQFLSLGELTKKLYISGHGGFHELDPARLQSPTHPPRPVLTAVRLKSLAPLPLGSIQSAQQPLRVDYTENEFHAQFVAFDEQYSGRNQYQYRLDGYDADWRGAGEQTTADYTNLPPGRYVFRLRASNTDGQWSGREAQFTFQIVPPYWQTWWFQVLVVLLVAGLLYGLYRYRLAQLLRVERVRSDIAADLHDEMGSVLTGIGIYGNIAQAQLHQPQPDALAVGNVVEQMQTSTRQLQEKMYELIWAVQPANDTGEQLEIRIKEHAIPLLEARGLDFSVAFDPALRSRRFDVAQRRHLFLFVKEALNNALRHANARRIAISLRLDGSWLEGRVADDGCGFDPAAEQGRGNGLDNLQRRADALGGTLRVVSFPGAGCNVVLRFRIR